MLKNYFTTAIRNLQRHRLYALINVLGLAIGLTSCILILLYVQYEWGFDRQHPQANQIYRMMRETKLTDGHSTFMPQISGALAGAIKRDIPEVKETVRYFKKWAAFKHQNQTHYRMFALVDPEFFNIFNFPMATGDLKSALRAPNSMLITPQTAQLLFGDEDPINKVVSITDDLIHAEFRITGLIKNPPPNSSIPFDCITTHIPSPHFARTQWEDWLPGSWRTTWNFVVLSEQASVGTVEEKLQNLMRQHMQPETSKNNAYHLQPLTRMHLYSGIDYGHNTRPDIYQIYMFVIIAGLILLIASVNFMNLATARSIERRKEVGVRKVVGAHKHQLIRQFLTESLLLSFIALIMAIFLSHLFLPAFKTLVGKNLTFDIHHIPSLIGLTILVGLLAGSYPAFFLSASKPIDVLKSVPQIRLSGGHFRKVLVIFQFVISMLFIMGTVTMYQQLQYMNTRDLGLDQGQVLRMWIYGRNSQLRKTSEHVKQRFLTHPNISKGTVVGYQGIRKLRSHAVRPEGFTHQKTMHYLGGDEDLIDVYGFELIAGRNIRQHAQHEFLINETAARQLGWANPIGKQIEWIDRKATGTVVGVTKDFHHASLHQKIEPVFIGNIYLPSQLLLKISPAHIPETLAFIETQWQALVPNVPFEFHFLDDRINQLYVEDRRIGKLTLISACLAIFIACLGLFGLASFMLERRTKEIGIRKVLGASVLQVIVLFTRNFIKLVILSGLIACPIAYYAINSWLQSFAYRIDLGLMPFFLGCLIPLIITFFTVGFQAYTAAMANPIDALKDE